jgi:hypothetical protein
MIRSINSMAHRERPLYFECRQLVSVLVFLCVLTIGSGLANAQSQTGNDALLGRWDLTVKTPSKEYPSWLQVSKEEGQLKAEMVGPVGNARPLPKVQIEGEEIEFVSPKEEEGRKEDMVFHGKLSGDGLVGTTTGPDGSRWTWTGTRAPTLKRDHAPQWGKPVSLFDGKSLNGWTLNDPAHAANWKVENGMLVKTGRGSELVSGGKFQDFKLHVEFNCDPSSNSGVYLRGRYEVQVETDSVAEPPSHHTGGVYGFLAPNPEQPRKPGVWQTFDITLIGRDVTVVHNGVTVIDHQEIPGITGGAVDSQEALPGPIYLQGSEENRVAFRNLVITPAKN